MINIATAPEFRAYLYDGVDMLDSTAIIVGI
jgi:hypothetical protein